MRRDGQFVGDFGPGETGTSAELALTGGESHDYELLLTVDGYRRGSTDRGSYTVLLTEQQPERRRDEQQRQRPAREDDLLERLEAELDRLNHPVRRLRERRTSRSLSERDPYFDYEAFTYEHWLVIGRQGDQALITMESDDIEPLLYVQQGVFSGRASGFDPMDWDYGRQGRRPACLSIRFPETTVYSVLAADALGEPEGRYEIQMQRHRGELSC